MVLPDFLGHEYSHSVYSSLPLGFALEGVLQKLTLGWKQLEGLTRLGIDQNRLDRG